MVVVHERRRELFFALKLTWGLRLGRLINMFPFSYLFSSVGGRCPPWGRMIDQRQLVSPGQHLSRLHSKRLHQGCLLRQRTRRLDHPVRLAFSESIRSDGLFTAFPQFQGFVRWGRQVKIPSIITMLMCSANGDGSVSAFFAVCIKNWPVEMFIYSLQGKSGRIC